VPFKANTKRRHHIPKESMQSSGDSRRGCCLDVGIDRAEVGVAPAEHAFEGVVQDGGADVKERLDRPPISAHLLAHSQRLVSGNTDWA
jgi:hypothetical protein